MPVPGTSQAAERDNNLRILGGLLREVRAAAGEQTAFIAAGQGSVSLYVDTGVDAVNGYLGDHGEIDDPRLLDVIGELTTARGDFDRGASQTSALMRLDMKAAQAVAVVAKLRTERPAPAIDARLKRSLTTALRGLEDTARTQKVAVVTGQALSAAIVDDQIHQIGCLLGGSDGAAPSALPDWFGTLFRGQGTPPLDHERVLDYVVQLRSEGAKYSAAWDSRDRVDTARAVSALDRLKLTAETIRTLVQGIPQVSTPELA